MPMDCTHIICPNKEGGIEFVNRKQFYSIGVYDSDASFLLTSQLAGMARLAHFWKQQDRRQFFGGILLLMASLWVTLYTLVDHIKRNQSSSQRMQKKCATMLYLGVLSVLLES